MRKKFFGMAALLILASISTASRKDEVTLVLMPREEGAARVGMDVANRYPTLLVSYQVSGGKVSLHGWNGSEWVNINLENYRSGDFFKSGPDSALLIEAEGKPIPEALIPPEEWCGAVYKITTTELRPLVHLTGQYYDFKYKDWAWFSENYKMPMDAINPERLNVAWYHKNLGEHLKKDAVVGDDLRYWVAVRHPQKVVVAEESAEEVVVAETNAVQEVERPVMETPEDPMSNPFTNEAPAAIVLGPVAVNGEE